MPSRNIPTYRSQAELNGSLYIIGGSTLGTLNHQSGRAIRPNSYCPSPTARNRHFISTPLATDTVTVTLVMTMTDTPQ